MLLDSLEHGGRDWNESRAYLNNLIKANPMDADARAALKDLNKAQALAKRLDQEYKFTSGKKPKTNLQLYDAMTEKLIGEGLIASLFGNKLEARDKFSEALKRTPNDKALKEIVADVQNDLDKRATALTAKGLWEGDRGNHLKEREYYQRALVFSPKDESIKEVLALTQNTLDAEAEKYLADGLMAGYFGNNLKEMQLYKKALIRKPNDQSIKEVIAHTQKMLDDEAHALSVKGINVSRGGNEQRALTYFKQALQRRPNDQGIKDVIKDSENRIAKANSRNLTK